MQIRVDDNNTRLLEDALKLVRSRFTKPPNVRRLVNDLLGVALNTLILRLSTEPQPDHKHD